MPLHVHTSYTAMFTKNFSSYEILLSGKVPKRYTFLKEALHLKLTEFWPIALLNVEGKLFLQLNFWAP